MFCILNDRSPVKWLAIAPKSRMISRYYRAETEPVNKVSNRYSVNARSDFPESPEY